MSTPTIEELQTEIDRLKARLATKPRIAIGKDMLRRLEQGETIELSVADLVPFDAGFGPTCPYCSGAHHDWQCPQQPGSGG